MEEYFYRLSVSGRALQYDAIRYQIGECVTETDAVGIRPADW